ncbi:hypothetical protein J4Q44_G00083960 [Coregonus suidteri]|uniref:Uncharacterized protein n=1 Tax=Coregonus suidteri TaxID=861788 RepID=A0AAN8LYV3_9TELE
MAKSLLVSSHTLSRYSDLATFSIGNCNGLHTTSLLISARGPPIQLPSFLTSNTTNTVLPCHHSTPSLNHGCWIDADGITLHTSFNMIVFIGEV